MVIHIRFDMMRRAIPEIIFVFSTETVTTSMLLELASMTETAASRFVIILFWLMIGCEYVSQWLLCDENVMDVVFVNVEEDIFKEFDLRVSWLRRYDNIKVIEDQQHVLLTLEVLTHTLVKLYA